MGHLCKLAYMIDGVGAILGILFMYLRYWPQTQNRPASASFISDAIDFYALPQAFEMFLKLRKKFKSHLVLSHYHTDFFLTQFIHAHRFLLEESSFMNSPPIPVLKTEAPGWHLDRHSNWGRVSTPPKTVRSSGTSAGCM